MEFGCTVRATYPKRNSDGEVEGLECVDFWLTAGLLRNLMRILLTALLAAVPALATVPLGCVGSTSLATFQLSVRPFSKGSPLPLKSVAAIPGG
jgi:hypothetical protein